MESRLCWAIRSLGRRFPRYRLYLEVYVRIPILRFPVPGHFSFRLWEADRLRLPLDRRSLSLTLPSLLSRPVLIVDQAAERSRSKAADVSVYTADSSLGRRSHFWVSNLLDYDIARNIINEWRFPTFSTRT